MKEAMLKKVIISGALGVWLAACSGGPKPVKPDANYGAPQGTLSLPDKTAFLQKDPRWANDRLGKSSDTMGTDGCLVTAAAMALGNLGFQTTPKDLNKRLTAQDSFTKQGWLIWSGIEKVTNGKANARYYDKVTDADINACLRDGYYPMTRFFLPSGRSHWAMIVKRDARGFHMRDPLRQSQSPLIFPRDSSAFKSLRCIGVGDNGKV